MLLAVNPFNTTERGEEVNDDSEVGSVFGRALKTSAAVLPDGQVPPAFEYLTHFVAFFTA